MDHIETSLDKWLDATVSLEATDLHLSVGLPPTVRVLGDLVVLEGQPVLGEAVLNTVARHLLGPRADEIDTRSDVDFSFGWRNDARFRGNVFRQRGRLAIALRFIPQRVPTAKTLGLPLVLEEFLDSSGLIILSGPAGAGKTTTLAALVGHINRNRRCHILTIEEPIEYLHEHDQAIVNQREVGSDVATFGEGLRAALREDPDVLVVGEMRDLESIEATLTIAETGQLVLVTVHSNDAAQTIDRIVDVFPANRRTQVQLQLAATLRAVVYQRLLPTLDGRRVAAFEVMVGTRAVANMVREGRTRQLRNAVATGQADGMQTLEDSLSALVASGEVAYEVAVWASLHPMEVIPPDEEP